MFDENNEFFFNNIKSVNRLVTNILVCVTFVAPVMMVCAKIGIFDIELKFSLSILLVTLFFSIIQLGFVYVLKFHKIAMFFGLIGMTVILGVMGSNAHVGIYASYVLTIFMSCLYYNLRLVNFITVFDWVAMLVSLYFKGIGTFEWRHELSPSMFMIAMGAGFTIEMIFSYLIANALTRHMKSAISKAEEKTETVRNNQIEIMRFIPRVLESHELFTGHHVRHTEHYVEMICYELVKQGHYADILTPSTIRNYAAAANLHDIGKVHIPDSILNKPGKYTKEEYMMMQAHPSEGKSLIEYLPVIDDGKFNRIASEMAYCHHERFDGTGYPRGIKGYDIPLSARIMAAADVLDALLSWRPYKAPFDISKTMDIFRESRGTHFEPEIVDAVLAVEKQIESISLMFLVSEKESEAKEFEWRNRLNFNAINKGTPKNSNS